MILTNRRVVSHRKRTLITLPSPKTHMVRMQLSNRFPVVPPSAYHFDCIFYSLVLTFVYSFANILSLFSVFSFAQNLDSRALHRHRCSKDIKNLDDDLKRRPNGPAGFSGSTYICTHKLYSHLFSFYLFIFFPYYL